MWWQWARVSDLFRSSMLSPSRLVVIMFYAKLMVAQLRLMMLVVSPLLDVKLMVAHLRM